MYTSLLPDASPCACNTVKKASRVLGRIYDARISGAGINITQFGLLRCIARRGGEPLVRIAEEMEMDRTSLYRSLGPMIREGWLLTAEGDDGRSRAARVTRKGRRVLAKANKNWAGMQRNIIEKFGQKKYDAFIAELNRLADCAAESN